MARQYTREELRWIGANELASMSLSERANCVEQIWQEADRLCVRELARDYEVVASDLRANIGD